MGFSGFWTVSNADGRDYDGEQPIEIYDHPERGLCVWFDDYAPGDSTLFSGNGHVPVLMSGLLFSPENVQGVAPLPAGADSENRVEVVATQDHVNSGAGGGCPPPSCSPS